MRSRQRLELLPGEYRDAKAGERRRTLVELLELLERSRSEPWYRWIADGRPPLTLDEYRAQTARRSRTQRAAA